MQQHPYWFGVSIAFTCGRCKHANNIKIVLNSPTDNPNKINALLGSLGLGCEQCQSLLTLGTQVKCEVTQGTLESLKSLGFVPIGNPLERKQN